jgi:NAD(P)-dependent dehydrogenase (short-subunit alcohol dehydrogenase family)
MASMSFQNKTVLVTGGASGIGLATAQLFAAGGANVVICGRNEEKGRKAEKSLAGGGKNVFLRCDVSSADDVTGLFRYIEKNYPSLDYAVNGAAISKKGKQSIDFTEAEYDEIMNINVKGVFFSMQGEIRLMLRQNRGVIVNISSVLGIRANNSQNALYTVSKHAVIGLTKETSLEYAPLGIRICAVLPSYTETEIIKDHLEDPAKRKAIVNLHPIRRIIQPGEVASAIMFLCSDDASAITGVLLPVDGGIMAM